MNAVSYLETGVLYCDDNLERLTQFPAECIDLIYLDPPFFSNRNYEVIWGDEAEVRSFEDRWEGGINVYVEWMRERVQEMHRILRPTGSFVLHCDPTASHYLKVMVDGVFGAAQFRNEIIWKRSAVKGDAKRKLGANHDVLFLYGKTADTFFEVPRRAPDEEYLARFDRDDGDGRGPYHSAPLDSPSPRPNLTYPYKGFDPPAKGWRVDKDAMKKLDDEGRLIFPSKPDGRIRRKLFLADAPGPPESDVWTDITPLQAGSDERMGYPTQKPEELLARLIKATTRKGEIVLDPFCGCGTTIAVAEQLGRKWSGIDISPTAVGLMKRRIEKLGGEVRTEGLPMTVEDLKGLKPFEFQNWVMHHLTATPSPTKSGDMGIDGVSFMYREPIQVKQSERVGRNVVDNFETAVERSGKDRGYIVAFSFTRGAYEEAARAKATGKVDISLIKITDLLDAAEAITRPGTPAPARKPTPDLMRLLTGAIQEAERTHPLVAAPARSAMPSTKELVESERA
jgi:DNA modification methylase